MRTEIGVKTINYSINGKSQETKKLGGKTLRYLSIRRFIELFLLMFFLPPFMLIFSLCSIALFFDMGWNIFFRQVRVGRYGLPFNIYKFKTITEIHRNGKSIKKISKLGQFFRKHHLDELPQYFNVLKGEMSLIGPRPEVFTEFLSFSTKITDYRKRKIVPQGLSGLAQIYVPNSQSIYDNIVKLKYDIQYINNISALLDLKILLKTFIVFLKGRELDNKYISKKKYFGKG